MAWLTGWIDELELRFEVDVEEILADLGVRPSTCRVIHVDFVERRRRRR